MTITSAALISQLDNPFWRFSLGVYQHEAVKKACLSFQEDQRANVNLLLLCCWLAYAVEDISRTQLLQACQTIDTWDEQVTQPLRNSRRWVKSLADTDHWIDDFGQQLLIDELVSETWQQYILYSYFQSRQKISFTKNEALAIDYLHWLFDDMELLVDNELEAKIDNFVKIIFSMVTNHEEKSTNNRD
jgi:uncharacterized protein (TIGR02444 family)